MNRRAHAEKHSPPGPNRGIANISNGSMATSRHNDVSRLLMRTIFSLLLLLHRYAEVECVPFVTQVWPGVENPGSFSELPYIAELMALLMVLFGLWTRGAALAIAINLGAAMLLLHSGDIHLFLAHQDPVLELHLLYVIFAVAVAYQGAGRYSIGGTNGRWN